MKKILIFNIFLNLLKKSFVNNNKINKNIFFSKVININNNFITIDAGLKSESNILIEEFKNNCNELEVNIGDNTYVFIENIEDKLGNIISSRKKAKYIMSWYKIEKIMKNKKIIQGFVTNRVKGGILILVDNINAFLPGSLLDIKRVRNNSNYESKILNLKVLKLDYKRNNIIVSRKATILKKKFKNRKKFFYSLKGKFIVSALIKNITRYGIFVNVGNVDGLAHITNLTWYKIKHPSELFFIGQKIKVKVLNFNKKKNRISLGVKQLKYNPWFNLAKKFIPGTSLTGIITNIVKYGFFVEIRKGFEGLVHHSEINWKNKNFYTKFYRGMRVKIAILFINPKLFRISLSMKKYNKKRLLKKKKKYKKGKLIKIIIFIKNLKILKFKLFNNIIGIINLFHLFKKKKNIFFKKKILKVKILSINLKKNLFLLG